MCKECRKIQQIEYRKKHPEWKIKNAQRMKSKRADGYKEPIENRYVQRLNQSAKKRGSIGTVTKQELLDLLSKHQKCEDCGSTEKLTKGHLIPLFYPIGKNVIENLIIQCMKCNRKQGTRIHARVATDELRQYYPVYVPEMVIRENIK